MTNRDRNAHNEASGRFMIPIDVIKHMHAPAKGIGHGRHVIPDDDGNRGDALSFRRDVTIDLESGTGSITLTEHTPEGVIRAVIGSGIEEPEVTISRPARKRTADVGKAPATPVAGRLAAMAGNRVRLVHVLFEAIRRLPDPVIRGFMRHRGGIDRIADEVRNAVIALSRDVPAPADPTPQSHGDAPAALTFPARPKQRISTLRQREELDSLLEESESRGAFAFEKIMSAEDMLSPGAMAERLDATRQTIDSWRKSRRLLALKGAKRGYRYPAWQIDGRGRLLPGLDKVLAAIGDDVAVFLWLRAPQPDYGAGTGADALRCRPPEDIIESIRRSGSSF